LKILYSTQLQLLLSIVCLQFLPCIYFLEKDNTISGVATGSLMKPIQSIPYVTPDLEPVVGTPKATLVSLFTVDQSEVFFISYYRIVHV
jgi:hypothetical protein